MGVHGYLYSQHLDLKFGTMVGKSICDLNDTFSCSAVAASKYSEVFGIPIALLGFFANLAVLVLLAMWPFTEDEKRPIARRNLLIATGGIAAVSIVMGTISTIAIGKLHLGLHSFIHRFRWRRFRNTRS